MAYFEVKTNFTSGFKRYNTVDGKLEEDKNGVIYKDIEVDCEHENFRGEEIIGRKQTAGESPMTGEYEDAVTSIMRRIRAYDGIVFHWGEEEVKVKKGELKKGKDISAPCKHKNHWLIKFYN